MITLEQIRTAFPDGERIGEKWVTRCILPGHEDKNPSLAISVVGGKVLCICTCNRQNELFPAVMKRLPKSGATHSDSSPVSAGSSWSYTAEKVQAAAQRIERRADFLKARGISMEVAKKHQVGLESIGGNEYLVIPTFFEGDLVAVKLRALYPISKNDKWKKWKRDEGIYWLFNREAAETAYLGDNLYIVESELDSLTAETAGYHAVSVDSAKHKLNERDSILLRRTGANRIFAPDSDGPGLACAVNLAAELEINGAVGIKWPGKDLGELYASNPAAFSESLDKLTENALPLWRRKFHVLGELAQGEPRQLVKQILPEGVTFFGSLSGVCKTWLAMSLSKALVTGEKFLNVWEVPEKHSVLYLCPEMGERSIRSRGEKLRLPVGDGFYCQTIADGAIALNDPLLLQAIRELNGPVVMLDTAIRFSGAESENDSSENASGLAMLAFSLLREGAVAVVCLHHSKKAQGEANFMTLENVLRGTGDFGAMADCVWGVQHARKRKGNNSWDDEYQFESKNLTRAYVECVKPRDLPAADPFIVQGRPYIDETGNLVVVASDAQVGEITDSGKVSEAAADKAEKLVREVPKISKNKLAQQTGISRNRVEEVMVRRGIRWKEISHTSGEWVVDAAGPQEDSNELF